MRSIRGSLNNFQPLIEVSVAPPDSGWPRKTVWGLIDTGATRTCLSERIIQQLALPARTKLLISSARTAPERRRAYGFSLGLFCERGGGMNAERALYVLPGEWIAPAFIDNGNFDVLIGVDILSTGRFVLEGSSFEFSFDA